MKLRLLPLTIAALLVIQFVEMNAQGDASPIEPEETGTAILIGPCAGINNVSQSADKLATFAGDPYCPFFDGGAGKGFYFGMTYEYQIGKNKAQSTSSIITRVMYSTFPGSMDSEGDEWPSLIEDQSNPTGWSVIRSSTKHDLDISYSLAVIEFVYKENFIEGNPVGITVGPTIGIPIQNQVTQEYNLVEPENVQFAEVAGYEYKNGRRTVVVQDGEIEEATAVRVGIKFGLQYELILGENYFIVPAIYYNYGVTKVKADEDWRINAFQFGVDLRYAFSL